VRKNFRFSIFDFRFADRAGRTGSRKIVAFRLASDEVDSTRRPIENRKSKIENQRRTRAAGFVLIEVMLGVMIFAMGVLALGKCVGNCITAESARQETERARLALENRMAEVEAGEVLTDQDRSDDLGDSFPGMTLKQSRHPLAAKNENGDIINGLYQVDLEVDWTTDNQPQSRMISFYVLRTK
jgi:hypothetical protein